MQIMVLTSCTGRKAVTHPAALTRDDFAHADRLRAREQELAELLRPAGAMYTGEQHLGVMRGVRQLREVVGTEAVAMRIVSAGYGVIAEDRPVAPYDVSFSTMSPKAARAWATALGIAADLRVALQGPDMVFVLLGARYLDAVQPPLPVRDGQRLIYFVSRGDLARVAWPGAVAIPAGVDECRLYGAGMIALKGRMLELLAAQVAQHGAVLLADIAGDATPRTVQHALAEAIRN